MAIILNDNIKINAGKPSEAKYLNPNTNVPYTGTTQVNTLVPISERHRGLTVLISDTEYWYKDGVANIDLILKSSGGSGERIEKKFTQSGHTFSFGDIIEYSGSSFQKALALSNRNAEVIGFVSQVPNANTFTVVMSGYISGISGLTLSPSTTYYLSDVAAGGLTSVEPTDPNTISKPVLTTITTNDAIVFQYRGFLNTTGVTGGGTMGLDPKESAHVATTGPLTGATYVASGGTNMSGAFTSAPSIVDGHALTINDRILVKDQVDPKQNGLYYLVFGNTWYRTTDQDGTPAAEVSVGNYVFVTTGATYGGTGWVIIGSGDTLTLNTDPIEWVQFNSVASYTEGDGINITGQIISADVENGLSFSNNKIVLGGTLTGDTTINGNSFKLDLGNAQSKLSELNTFANDQINIFTNGNLLITGSSTNLGSQTDQGSTSLVYIYAVGNGNVDSLGTDFSLGTNAFGTTALFQNYNTVVNDVTSVVKLLNYTTITGITAGHGTKLDFSNSPSQLGAGIAYVDIDPNDVTYSAKFRFDVHSGNSTTVIPVLEIHNSGATYVSDYSANFTPRSLVDKGYVTGLTSSAASKSSTTITGTSGGTTTFNVVHNKNTRDVIVQVYEVASPYGTVIVDVERVTVNAVDVKFAIAPATGVQYRVVII